MFSSQVDRQKEMEKIKQQLETQRDIQEDQDDEQFVNLGEQLCRFYFINLFFSARLRVLELARRHKRAR